MTFIGSHLDVVPANPDTWSHDPFKLTVEGDKLYGRGTTDCLGHVAMITELFLQLADTTPDLKRKVVAVFIARYIVNLLLSIQFSKVPEFNIINGQ